MSSAADVRHAATTMSEAKPGTAPLGRDIAEAFHNMSAPPKSVIQFEGLGALAERGQPGGSGVTSLGYGGRRIFGTPVRFALPSAWRRLKSPGILRRVDPTAAPTPREQCDACLGRLINGRARALPLPAGCVLIPPRDSHPVLWDDGLTALAVLAKCTDTVWLRGRAPSLAAALERWSVSLLVPPAFAADLPAPPANPPGNKRNRRNS